MRAHSHAPNAPVNAKAVVSGCRPGPVGSERRKRGALPHPKYSSQAGIHSGSLQPPREAEGTEQHHGGEGGGRDAAGADVGLRRSRSARIKVPPQQKAPLRAVSRRFTEHQPRQRMRESPSPAASPEPDPLLHLLRAWIAAPLPPPPPPGYSQESLPALSGSFILSLPSSLYRDTDTARQPPAAGPGDAPGASPARCLRRGVQRSSPARGGSGGTTPGVPPLPSPARRRGATGTPREGDRRLGGRRLPWMPVW